ncbi:cytochrome c [Thioclava sp. GXIMD4216]|uniref:Cytochrome c n=1 Tax=Thioclava litoralis TaxID=3076557 RepID=A0ABZ1E3G5_9RHOB|nr:cytochrome c [Thioclava sp. FTW29]
MQRFITFSAAVLLMGSSVAAVYADVADPTVKAWQDGMKELRQSSNILGDMAKGKSSFDAEIAASAASALKEEAKKVAPLFEAKATDPESEAKSSIWDNWEAFTSHATDLEVASAQMDTSSLAGVREGMQAVGAACGGCHKQFKE